MLITKIIGMVDLVEFFIHLLQQVANQTCQVCVSPLFV